MEGKGTQKESLTLLQKGHAELFSKAGNQFDAGSGQLHELTRYSQGDRQLWSFQCTSSGTLVSHQPCEFGIIIAILMVRKA